jgi:hypothetical protein
VIIVVIVEAVLLLGLVRYVEKRLAPWIATPDW